MSSPARSFDPKIGGSAPHVVTFLRAFDNLFAQMEETRPHLNNARCTSAKCQKNDKLQSLCELWLNYGNFAVKSSSNVSGASLADAGGGERSSGR